MLFLTGSDWSTILFRPGSTSFHPFPEIYEISNKFTPELSGYMLLDLQLLHAHRSGVLFGVFIIVWCRV